jgi:RNA polymerase sigma-70 factor (ECF subfamily)
MVEHTEQIFNQYRWLLFSIAYRMLGSGTEAEDIVQEAFLRWLEADEDAVQSPRAYLSTVVVRLCIDQQRSARAQREVYTGTWLPEPILTEQQPELIETAALAESLSLAFLVMLENLGPLERAVFLLREAFEFEYAEIAEMVGKSEANCRQILHRAQQRLGQRRGRFDVSHEQQERITAQFLQASTSGDIDGFLQLLSDDIVFTADGGGKAKAGLKPVRGRDKVVRGTLSGLRALLPVMVTRIAMVNGQPAIIGYIDGRPYGVIILDIVDEHISQIYAILNPDKLRSIPPLSH